MLNFIIIFLFAIGTFIYVRNTKWALLYCVLVQILSLPLFSLMANCPFQHSLGDVANIVSKFSMYYFLVFSVIMLCRSNISSKCHKLLFAFAIFSFYVLLSKVFITGTFATVPTVIMEVAFPVLLFLAIFSNPNCVINDSKLKVLTRNIIILELVVCGINAFGIYLFIPHYFPTVVEGQWGNYYTLNESKIAGTFDRYNSLAGFLATVYMFVLHLYFVRKWIVRRKFYIITIAFLIVVLMTGAKISLVSMLLFLGAYSFKYKKKTRMPIMALGLCFSFILTLLASYTPGTISNDGIDRQFTGFANAINGDKGEDNSTLSLSSYLLENYLDKAPLIGNNNLWKGKDAYGNFTNHSLELFNADAKLALILVDSGILGFSLNILCFWFIFKIMCTSLPQKDRWGILMLFCYYFIQTITDGGFFDVFLFPLSYIFFNYLRCSQTSIQVKK